MPRAALSTVILFAAAVAVPVAALAQMTPQEAVLEMGRGINLGNTLEPPNEGEWDNPPAEEYYFDDYVEAGFGTVRIPVRWDEHTATVSPFPIDSAWMNRVEEVVDWALARGLIVILNTHHEEWIKANYADATQRARFDSIWNQIAGRFAGKSERLLMEIINEPFGMTLSQINQMNARILGIIRVHNPTRIVIYSGHGYSNSAELMAAAIPNDPYLVGYYHSYDPWDFSGLATRGWGTEADRQAVRAQIQSVRSWSVNNNVPAILSEFGAIHANDYNDRMRYYAAVVEETVEAGIPFQVWDDGGDFRLYDRENRAWPPLKDLLVHGHPDSPTDLAFSVRSDSIVTVSWTNRHTFGTGISLQRAEVGGDFVTVAEVPSSAQEAEDIGVSGGKTHEYRLILRGGQGPDRYSYSQRFFVPGFERFNFQGTPFPIPGVIEAEDFDIGGEGLTYHDSDDVNTPGGYRSAGGVDIEARTDGGWQIAYIEAGEWLEYTVDVETAGTYEVTTTIASLEGFGRLRLSLGGVDGPIMRAPNTGSWQTTQDVVTSMDLAAGEQIMRMSVLTSNPFNVDKYVFQLAGSTSVEADMPRRSDLSVYPNPAADHLRLEGVSAGTIVISDLLGRRLLSHAATGDATLIPVSSLPPGVYLLRVESEGESQVQVFSKR